MISEEAQIKMFGATIETLNDAIEESYDPLMLSMQMISDAQEAMHHDPEVARQYLNRAKHVIDAQRRKAM